MDKRIEIDRELELLRKIESLEQDKYNLEKELYDMEDSRNELARMVGIR